MSEEIKNETQLPANPLAPLFDQFKEQSSFAGKAVVGYAVRETLMTQSNDAKEVERHQDILFNQAIQMERLHMDKEKWEFDKSYKQEQLALQKEEAKRRQSALVMKMKDDPAMLIGVWISTIKSYTQMDQLIDSICKVFYTSYGYNGDLGELRHKALELNDIDTADLIEAFQRLISKVKYQ